MGTVSAGKKRFGSPFSFSCGQLGLHDVIEPVVTIDAKWLRRSCG